MKTFDDYLSEGKFKKIVDNQLVNKALKYLKTKMITTKADRSAEDYDKAQDMRKQTSAQMMREYVEEFIYAIMTQGEMSHAGKTFDSYDDAGTAIWIIKIMNELNQATVPMSKIEKFEMDLTDFVKKNSGGKIR